ncbi:MAG: apolipoprotein N-acyltransferase [Candidatus Krumholzibacteria bacterium]|nr:apolipoprotein N-acyltransferase [Candidatus Krumholzibacteria bacterium]
METTTQFHDLSPRRARPSRETWVALLSGLVITAGLPPYSGTGALVPLAMALLFWALLGTDKPARTAWFFGLTHQASTLYWLFLLDPSKSIPSPALVPIQALVAIGYVSLFYLLLGWVHGRLRSRLGTARSLLMLPVLWVAMEALRSRGELGFAWCLSGSSVIGGPLLSLARASGEIGVGAGLAFVAALGAALLVRRRGASEQVVDARAVTMLAAGTAAVWIFLFLGAQAEPASPASHAQLADSLGYQGKAVPVAAIQADVALADKWNKARLDATKIPYRELSAQAGREGAELIVWAETSVPAYVRYDADLLAWLRETVIESGAWLLAGFPDADRSPEGEVRTYNSSGLFDPRGAQRDRYAKHHLLPIGESMPFQSWLPFLAGVNVGQAEWTPGPPPEPMNIGLKNGGFRISGLICFESAFGQLARDSVRRGSQCLVVITNDGWFGKSAGPRQHAWLARLRAVECGVPVIRCANNGISFIADAEGNILDSLDLGQRGVVRAEIVPGQGRTLFVKLGAWPLLVWSVLWLLMAAVAPVERRK